MVQGGGRVSVAGVSCFLRSRPIEVLIHCLSTVPPLASVLQAASCYDMRAAHEAMCCTRKNTVGERSGAAKLRSGAASRVFACAAQASCAAAHATALAIWTDFGTTALEAFRRPRTLRSRAATARSSCQTSEGTATPKILALNGFRRARRAKDAFAENRRDAIFHALPFLRTLKPTASFRVSSGTQRNL